MAAVVVARSLVLWAAAAAGLLLLAGAQNQTGTPKPTATAEKGGVSGQGHHEEGAADGGSVRGGASSTSGSFSTSGSSAAGGFGLGLPALRRAFYVTVALGSLVLVYYLCGRVMRTRKPPRKKYGLLSNSEDNMEMASMESDEDTVFETRNLRR
ncbi:protein FAM174C [Hemicordylus capensis]|uniref:protein FAM174C n=1 Tax=Hemicordylus capensis TaxID=884348 RepID=UPI00230320F5|nr:protein FAM174C [Hemicordylus capensis]